MTVYAAGAIFKSTTNVFLVTTGGTTAASPPSFTTTSVGSATTDGTAVVKFIGTTGAFTVTTHYGLSAEAARIAILATGNLAEACALYTTVTEGYLSLNVDYTTDANSRTQITSSGSGTVAGQFRFIADNAERLHRRLPTRSLDEHLLAALDHGLPPSAGVAVGFDRLLMVASGAEHIRDVMTFTTEHA